MGLEMRACVVKPFALIAIASLFMLAISIFSMGNVSAAPVTTLTVTGPTYGTSPTYVNFLTEFTLTSPEDSEIWYRWDSHDYIKYTGPFSTVIFLGSEGGAPALPQDLEEGLHTLMYNSTGEVPKSAQFHLDSRGPTTAISFTGTHFPGDYEFIIPSTRLVFSASDDGSGLDSIQYRVNQGPFSTYTVPFILPGNGLHTINYFSFDRLGNREQERILNVFVDNEAPSIDFVFDYVESDGTIFLEGNATIALDFSDSSGIADSLYRIGAGEWAPYLGPFTLPSEGTHVITARATDNLGHTSPENSITVTVDATAPRVSVTGASGGSVHLKKGELLEIQCIDTGAGGCTVYYSFNRGATWYSYLEPISVEEDVHVTYYAVDALGNTAEQGTVMVYVEGSRDARPYLIATAIIIGAAVTISSFLLLRRSHLETSAGPPETGSRDKRAEPSVREEEHSSMENRRKRRNY